MMNDNLPKVSILVPIYNVEKYLRRCIDSVLAQDFTDYELILVDDGSPDGCPKICDEYVQRDDRIKVVHKENGGLVSARLAGFQEARGEYLMFLDSDDYLLEGAVRCLYEEITEGGYDIVKTRPLRENNAGKRWMESYCVNEGEICDNETYIIDMLHNKISPYLHSAIYKKGLFGASVFERVMDGGISIGEDWVTNMLISGNIKKAKIVNKSVYVYYWNDSSMMASTIISPRLSEKVDKVLAEFYASSGVRIMHEHEVKLIVGYIHANFFWEIPYNVSWYERVRSFISIPQNREEVFNLVDRKHRFFIDQKYFFGIYSRLYAFLTFVVKQKCVHRKVIN